MFEKFIQFIKFNNATVIIVLAFLIVGTGVLASETGQELLGEKKVRVEGIDNTALLETDLDEMDMNFSIEDIGEDDNYYNVRYTYFDLEKEDGVWEYQLKEKTRKVSKKSRVDLDKYLAEELKEEYQARIKYLKEQQGEAENIGLEKKVQISEYSGLIGKTLALADGVFGEYEAVKVRVLPTPINSILLKELKLVGNEGAIDGFTDIYNDYIDKNDPDGDEILNNDDNCPSDYNPGQGDRDEDGVGDVCDTNPDIDIDTDVATPTPEVVEGDEPLENPIETSIEVSNEEEPLEDTSGEPEDDQNNEHEDTEEESVEETPAESSEEPPANEEPDVVIVELEE